MPQRLTVARRALPGLWLAAILAAGCGPAPPEHARNLILISIDTLRAEMLGAYGYPRPTSPTLDALAARGVLFEAAVSTSPWTLPAHASLLTGLYPSRHGVKSHDVSLPKEVTTLAELLARRGFVTAGIVNSHNLTDRYGLHRGFQAYDYVIEVENRARPSQVERLALESLEWLRRGPFFLFLHFYDVHSDYRSLARYETAFRRPYGGDVDGSTHQLRRFREGARSLDLDDARSLVDRYVAGIRQMDDGVARLLRALEQHDRLADTLLIVTSDHGEEFLEHGGVLHGRTQYDEVMRVPLMLSGPGVPAGVRIREPVSLVDVVPTALSSLGLPIPEELDGLDLSPLWSGEPAVDLRDRFLFGEADHGNRRSDLTRSVRHRSFKLILHRGSGETALHDLAADPRETRDAQGEHAELAALLRAKLDEFMRTETLGGTQPPLRELEPEEVERLRALGYL